MRIGFPEVRTSEPLNSEARTHKSDTTIIVKCCLELLCGHSGEIKTEFALEFFDTFKNLLQHGLFDSG